MRAPDHRLGGTPGPQAGALGIAGRYSSGNGRSATSHPLIR
jgi:hypothetical protein